MAYHRISGIKISGSKSINGGSVSVAKSAASSGGNVAASAAIAKWQQRRRR